MIKLLTIIGARPQIIKAAAISRAIAQNFSQDIEEKILHTGQHYDTNMSEIFFDELGIPRPDFNLCVGSGSHGEQTAKMIEGIEKILQTEKFDGIVVYGDTNSTIAGTLAASKLHVPIFHIEAGLRSFNMGMPEEINRIVCDHLSSVLFAPTQTALDNLEREGIGESRAIFTNGKKRKIVNSGDIMYDNSMFFSSIAGSKSKIIQTLGLSKDGYVLATIHRNNNTDDPQRLESITRALLDISSLYKVPVVIPLHPRTSKILKKNLQEDTYKRFVSSKTIRIIPPVSFFDIIELEKNAKIIMTDSGGVQKEAFFFEKPCVILRSETEWIEIVKNKAGVIADADYNRIMEGYRTLNSKQIHFPQLFGDGQAANYILTEILNYLKND